MLEFPLWKKLWLWGLTLAASVLALPSLFNVSGLDWPASLPNPQVNLGLDLAGGSHLLLEARPTISAPSGSRTWKRPSAS